MRRRGRRRGSASRLSFLLAFCALLFAAQPLAAEPQPQPEPQQKQLVVAVYEAPPWCMKQPDGSWHGVTVDLWKALASDVGLKYRLEEIPVGQILDGVATGRFATSAGPWAATVERQQSMDFTHSYVTTGLSIAIRHTGNGTGGSHSSRRSRRRRRSSSTWASACSRSAPGQPCGCSSGAVIRSPRRPLPGVGAGLWWAGVPPRASATGTRCRSRSGEGPWRSSGCSSASS